jgi:archaemetzincin
MKYLYVGAAPDLVSADERAALAQVRAHLEAEFFVPVRELALPPLDFAFDANRAQYASIAVLEMLARLCPADASKLVAVTGRDLFIPVLTFVFGQAQLGGRVAVVSLARLRQEFYGLEPDAEVLRGRAAREALHETGHAFGLVHCLDRDCAMALVTGVRQIDWRRNAFCPACAALVRRIRGRGTVAP